VGIGVVGPQAQTLKKDNKRINRVAMCVERLPLSKLSQQHASAQK
jgi:hypothetical protein